MNVHDAPHRRLGVPCCGAARQPKIPVAARGGGREVGTVRRLPLEVRQVATIRLRRSDRRASYVCYVLLIKYLAYISSSISISPRDRRVLQASHRLNQNTLVPRCHSRIPSSRLSSLLPSAPLHNLWHLASSPSHGYPLPHHQPFLVRCVFLRPLGN